MARRPEKPRQVGLTHVLDKGLSASDLASNLATGGEFADIWKFGFGSSRLYSKSELQAKLDILSQFQVSACPGGTLMEVAFAQQKVDAYLDDAWAAGFRHVEVSDGVVSMERDEKLNIIKSASQKGFKVVSEIGRKLAEEDAKLTIDDRINSAKEELDAGSWKVVMEARESGTFGLFGKDTAIKQDELNEFLGAVTPSDVIFEAPLTKQQAALIEDIGVDVNLGNIPPADLLSVEALRTGFRGDTLGWLQPPKIQ